MTPDILIAVPVLSRPQNARPLIESIQETANSDWQLVFVCSANDDAEIEACFVTRDLSDRVGITILPDPPESGQYAAKIQAGYDNDLYADVPLVLLAADDLKFHPGWDTNALKVFEETGAGVVGTVDCGNRQTSIGKHATHPFVSREYIDTLGGVVGEPGTVYHQGYDHQMVDLELCQTAMARGRYAHAFDSVIEHLHPLWNKSEYDATYRRGSSGFSKDKILYERRRHLWESKAT